MHDDLYKRERRKQARLDKLGTNDPHCAMCGESDWRIIEQHHVADYGRDKTVVLLCRNCHRKVSDDQKDNPAPLACGEPMLETIGHFLLGLADMLRTIAPRLQAFGRWLIEYARGMQATP